MWDYKKEDLQEEVKIGGDFINQSGCYSMNIDDIEDKETRNGAKQVVFKLSTEEGAKVNIFYIYAKINGEMIDFKVRHLNQLCGLLKITPDKLENMKNKQIGVFLKAKGTSQDGKFINWDIDGFYDIKTKGTAKELNDKSGIGDTYSKFEEKYDKESPVETNYSSGNISNDVKEDDSSDDFPF